MAGLKDPGLRHLKGKISTQIAYDSTCVEMKRCSNTKGLSFVPKQRKGKDKCRGMCSRAGEVEDEHICMRDLTLTRAPGNRVVENLC